MDAKDRRRITQTTGAFVILEGQRGEVVGHYDDDIVFVLFDGETEPTSVYVAALTLVK